MSSYENDDLWPWPPEVMPYLPVLDENWNCDEDEEVYVERMKVLLPLWPEELLREWCYRHWNDLDDYAFLDFKTLRFELQSWPLEAIPGRDAFADPEFCDDFSSTFEVRRENKHDWLVHYMSERGTWNTPIVLLNNPNGLLTGTEFKPLRSPWHLLEGHRRLSFLNALRESGRARAEHAVWVAEKVSFTGRR